MIRSGDLLKLDGRASAQFAVAPITIRVIRVLDEHERCEGWIWVEGYQLDDAGDAYERRQVYFQADGAEHVQPPNAKRAAPTRIKTG